MNEKLIVKDFGPIKNAELDLKKVTIFIGPQGSGKSTLAKLITLCKEEERPLLNNVESSIPFRIYDYGIGNFLKNDTSFQYYSKLSQIGFNNSVFLQSWTELGNKISSKLDPLEEKLLDAKKKGIDLSIDSFFNTELQYLNILKDNNIIAPIYIPEKRSSIPFLTFSLFGLMSNNVNLPKILTQFGNKYAIASTNDAIDDMRFVQVKNHFPGSNKSKYIELFDLQFQHRDGQDFLIDTKNNYEINLRDSASGMQSSIPLILVVRHEYSKGNKHFIVEEPELNLFPTTQKELVGYLADKCTQNGNELLMTTHSPYVLSAINNLIFAYKVAHEVPEKAEEVAKIIPREQWLNPDDVAAYYVADGTVQSIIHEGEGLIGENELDAISEDISGERDQLFKILRSKKRETVN
jgi:AAA15 family ATPase/GTPase